MRRTEKEQAELLVINTAIKYAEVRDDYDAFIEHMNFVRKVAQTTGYRTHFIKKTLKKHTEIHKILGIHFY